MTGPAQKRLLLVDDEEGIRRVLGVLLADLGYAVVSARDGLEALALLEAAPPAEFPSVIVSDIKMPGLDGLGLLKAVKGRWPGLEVLMLTGHGDMELAIASLQLGAGDFLNKPVSDAALEVSLRRAEERLAMREALRRHTEELETLVERRSRELIESERFAAVGEAAASMAHAIKNIAGGLEGTMFVLEKALSQNKREYLEEGWEMIKGDVGRLKTLAVELLDLGKSRALHYAGADPSALAGDLAGLFRARAESGGIRLELEDQAGPSPFVMAREAVHECLSNLVLNAIEALEGAQMRQGLVRIRVERHTGDGGKRLRFLVIDNGPGLAPGLESAQAPRFISSKEGGSGVGLFATRKLAREMGAEFVLKSGPHGTEAVLELTEKYE